MLENTGKKYIVYSTTLIVYVFIMQYLNVALVVDGMNLLYPSLEAKFGWTRAALGAATSGAVYVSIVSAVIIGTLMMKFNIKKILQPAIILLGLDLIFMAYTTSFQGFAIAMIVLQVLCIALMTGSFAMVSNWFRNKRGTIMGIVTIGCPLSSATFVMIGTKVSMRLGFEVFYGAVGVLIFILGILGIFVLRNSPEDIGYGIDGAPLEECETREDDAMEGKTRWSFWDMMKNKEMWLISLGWGFIFLMMTGIMSTAIPRFVEVGISREKATLFFSAAAVLGMPFSYFWGWLDDKVGTPKACAIFAVCYIFGSICFLFGSADRMAIAFGGIVAIAMTTGGMPNLQPSIQAWVYGRREFVSTYRYTGVIQNIFRGTAFAYMGIIFTRTGSYDGAYISFIVMAVLTIICFTLIKTTYDPENKASVNHTGSCAGDTETASA